MNLFRKILLASCLLIAQVNVYAQIITTFAGNGMAVGPLGDGGAATAARLGLISSLDIDSIGNVYIADGSNQRVRKVDAVSGIITTVAGTGTAGFNGDGLLATSTQLNLPSVVAFDPSGNLYIGEGGNFRVRKVAANTGIVSTFLGTGVFGYSIDGTPATTANIYGGFFDFDSSGIFYTADEKSDTCFIRKVNLTGIYSTIGGTGPFGCSGDGGAATNATMHVLLGICADKKGNVYITDAGASIRKISASTGIITRVAGTGDSIGIPYSGDGGPATAAHIAPNGVAVDDIGNIYIADNGNHRIEVVDTFGIIHSIAGTGTSGFSGDNGSAMAAKMSYPRNIRLDPCGNLYVADWNNKRVRKITYPSNPTISITGITSTTIGSTVTVTANVANAGHYYSIKWYNKGVLFTTTTVPVVSYTKTISTDSITARVYGCSDSSLSGLHIVTDSETDVLDQQSTAGNMHVYPNPVISLLHIDVTTLVSYSVSNIVGSVLQKGLLKAGSNTLDLNDYAHGIYFITLTNKNGIKQVHKITKE